MSNLQSKLTLIDKLKNNNQYLFDFVLSIANVRKPDSLDREEVVKQAKQIIKHIQQQY